MKKLMISMVLFISTSLFSQTKIDIEVDGTDVYLSTNVDGVMSGITFTSKSKSNIDFVYNESILNFNILQSGESIDSDGYIYKTYAGFSLLPMLVEDRFLIGKFTKSCEIIKDQVSESMNGDYYLSINGIDRSGDIKILNIQDEINIFPNPFNEEVRVNRSGAHFQMYNIIGEVMIDEFSSDGAIKTKDLPNGTYLIRITDINGKTINVMGVKSNYN